MSGAGLVGGVGGVGSPGLGGVGAPTPPSAQNVPAACTAADGLAAWWTVTAACAPSAA